MIPEIEDSVVDFNWTDDHMKTQENLSRNANENSERKKELLRKLNRRKNPPAISHPSLPQLSGIGRGAEAQEESDVREMDTALVREAVAKVNLSGGGEMSGLNSDPDQSDMLDTLGRDCIHHSGNKTKHFCNDCKIFVCIQCIAFGDHGRPHRASNEEDSRAILREMVLKRRQEHSTEEMERILKEGREEHNEQFEALLKEVTNFIRLYQEKSLDSWDAETKALIDIAKASTNEEVRRLHQTVKTYSPEKGSVQYSQPENALSIVLPRIPFHKAGPPLMDLNANYTAILNLEENTSDKEKNTLAANIPCSPIASSTPTASITESEIEKHEASTAKEERVRIMFVETPDKIYLRRKSRDGDWEGMKSWIEEEALTAKPVDPKKGQTLLCRVGPNNWFRCVVKTVQDSIFKVKLIDVGKTVLVSLRDIRDISRKLKGIESLIDCFKLDVESPGSTWPASTLEKLREFLPEGEEVYVKELNGGSKDLLKRTLTADNPFDPPTLLTESVSSFLVDNGMALKMGTHQRTNFSSRMSANLWGDAKNPFRRPISLQTTITDGDVVHDSLTCVTTDILPFVPRQQVFEAVMTHVDDKAVVWVVPQTDMPRLTEVTAKCLECNETESNVEVGCLYVARQGNTRVRVRVLKSLEDGTFYATIVDSGEVLISNGDGLFKASRALLHTPPLAVPLKLYGVKKAVGDIGEYIHEDITGPRLGLVTVMVLEENVTDLPLPAHVLFAKSGSRCGGNLAFTMLSKGLVRVITSYDDWSLEFNDHGLEWMLGMSPKLHNLDILPFPLPLASGTWLCVFVEGLEYMLKEGEEVEPNIHYKDANRVGCRVIPTNHLLNFGHGERQQKEIGDSLRISEAQVTEINRAFLRLTEKLRKAADVASLVQSYTRGLPVLAYYSYGAGSDGEWCRANLTSEQCLKDDYVWVFFVDYGHRAMVPKSGIRVLDESLRREPVYLLNVRFKMPNETCQLRTIRREIKDREDETLIMVKVVSTLPKVYPHVTESFVGFSKAVKDHGKNETYSIANVC